MAEPSFIVFGDDWGAHPSSVQHLFKRIARTHRTLWVNTLGLRVLDPGMTDAASAPPGECSQGGHRVSAGGTSDTRWELPGPCSRVVGMLVQGTASLRLRSR